MISREATLDDWAGLKRLVDWIRRDPAFSKILAITEAEMEAALVNSRLPQIPYRLQVVVEGKWNKVLGFAICCLHSGSQMYSPGAESGQPNCYIHAAFVSPAAPRRAGLLLYQGVEDWARSGNALQLYGNVRLEGSFGGFARKYGLKPLYTAIGKVL